MGVGVPAQPAELLLQLCHLLSLGLELLPALPGLLLCCGGQAGQALGESGGSIPDPKPSPHHRIPLDFPIPWPCW